jgi:hypothetical protein
MHNRIPSGKARGAVELTRIAVACAAARRRLVFSPVNWPFHQLLRLLHQLLGLFTSYFAFFPQLIGLFTSYFVFFTS